MIEPADNYTSDITSDYASELSDSTSTQKSSSGRTIRRPKLLMDETSSRKKIKKKVQKERKKQLVKPSDTQHDRSDQDHKQQSPASTQSRDVHQIPSFTQEVIAPSEKNSNTALAPYGTHNHVLRRVDNDFVADQNVHISTKLSRYRCVMCGYHFTSTGVAIEKHNGIDPIRSISDIKCFIYVCPFKDCLDDKHAPLVQM